MDERRSSGRVKDTVVKIDGREVECCRADLIASSEYFYRMLGSRVPKARFNVVIPRGVMTADTFEAVLRFMYTSEVQITTENAYHLLKATDFLKLYDNKLPEKCVIFIERNLPIKHMMGAIILARMTRRERLHYQIANYISLHLDDLSRTRDFLELPFEDIQMIIDASPLNEAVVMMTTIQWINHKREERWRYFKQLSYLGMIAGVSLCTLKCIASAIIPDAVSREDKSSFLDDLKKTSVRESLVVYWRLRSADPSWESAPSANIVEVSIGHSIESRILETDSQVCGMKRVAFDESCIYSLNFIHGGIIDGTSRFAFYSYASGITGSKENTLLTSPTTDGPFPYFNPGLQMVGLKSMKQIYLCMDCSVGLHVYDCDTDKWCRLNATTPLEWASIAACETNNTVYLLGGEMDKNTYLLAFDPRTEKFTELSKSNFTYTAGTLMCALHGKLYIYNELCQVYEIYDPTTNEWNFSRPNPYVDAHSTKHVVVYDDELWLFNAAVRKRMYFSKATGLRETGDEQKLAYMAYLYRPALNSWRKFPLMRSAMERFEKVGNFTYTDSYLLDAITL